MLTRGRLRFSVLIFTLLLVLTSTAGQAAVLDLPDQRYFTHTRAWTLRNTGSVMAEDVVAEVALYPNITSPYQIVYDEVISPQPMDTKVDAQGNRTAQIYVGKLLPGASINISVGYNLLSSGVHYDQEQLALAKAASDPNLDLYLRAENKIEVGDPDIVKAAKAIIGSELRPYRQASKIYAYITQTMTYDTSSTYAHQGALSALHTQKGVCDDYAALMIALLRQVGIPARMVDGYRLTVDDQKWANSFDGSQQAHAWVEFYLSGQGWVVAEPTTTYTVSGSPQVPWFDFANLDRAGHLINGYGLQDTEIKYRWSSIGGGAQLHLTSETDRIAVGQSNFADTVIPVYLNGQRITFDAHPSIVADRVYVPMRAVFDALGAQVDWNAPLHQVTATKESITLALRIGDNTMEINGRSSHLDAPPFIQENRTMVPLRVISESLGVQVQWDAAGRSVYLSR